MNTKTHYEVLDLESTASAQEIKESYRLHAAAWHPDRHMGTSRNRAEAKMKEINGAYKVLSDVETRRAYDATIGYTSQTRATSNVREQSASRELPKGYENESKRAQQLVLDRPHYWSHLLVAEMLKMRLDAIRKDYETLKIGSTPHDLKKLDDWSYKTWVSGMLSSLTAIYDDMDVVFLKDANSVVSALERDNTIVHPSKILRVVNKTEKFCLRLPEWERQVALVEPPPKFKKLHSLITSATVSLFDVICEFQENLESLMSRPLTAKTYVMNVDISLPDNWDEIVAEVELLKKKPNFYGSSASDQYLDEEVEYAKPANVTNSSAHAIKMGRRVHDFNDLVELWPTVVIQASKKMGIAHLGYLKNADPVAFNSDEITISFKSRLDCDKALENRMELEQVINECLSEPHKLRIQQMNEIED